jgi:hypothetical protein
MCCLLSSYEALLSTTILPDVTVSPTAHLVTVSFLTTDDT